ncbi:MAG: 23S rRNA (pseudouridine(1915)-N(3))-methyltransferase RlmH [Acidobacteriota bacterium]
MARTGPMRIEIHFVGKPASGPLAPAIADYTARIEKLCTLRLVNCPTLESRSAEGRRLMDGLSGNDFVALNTAGKRQSSHEFYAMVAAAQLNRDHTIRFVIGGATGLPEAVLAEAERQISLSELTMSHDLARLVLLEQIYRALATIAGSPYAK